MKENWQDPEFVEWYNQHLRFENGQIEKYISALQLGEQDSLVDFGCGNGMLLEQAAPLVESAVGVDGSSEQLKKAKERLEGLKNVLLINAGFLDCDLQGRVFTRGSARKALHHLTDDEKLCFFDKISLNFKRDALFMLEDAVFDFEKERLEENKERLFAEAEAFYAERWNSMKEAFTETIIEEYPTDKKNWEAALAKAGFEIIRYDRITCFYGKILARKV